MWSLIPTFSEQPRLCDTRGTCSAGSPCLGSTEAQPGEQELGRTGSDRRRWALGRDCRTQRQGWHAALGSSLAQLFQRGYLVKDTAPCPSPCGAPTGRCWCVPARGFGTHSGSWWAQECQLLLAVAERRAGTARSLGGKEHWGLKGPVAPFNPCFDDGVARLPQESRICSGHAMVLSSCCGAGAQTHSSPVVCCLALSPVGAHEARGQDLPLGCSSCLVGMVQGYESTSVLGGSVLPTPCPCSTGSCCLWL